jgi:hypothetical protein
MPGTGHKRGCGKPELGLSEVRAFNFWTCVFKRGNTGKKADKNKNGRDACACRPEFVCEVVRPANREHTYLEGLDVRDLQSGAVSLR